MGGDVGRARGIPRREVCAAWTANLQNAFATPWPDLGPGQNIADHQLRFRCARKTVVCTAMPVAASIPSPPGRTIHARASTLFYEDADGLLVDGHAWRRAAMLLGRRQDVPAVHNLGDDGLTRMTTFCYWHRRRRPGPACGWPCSQGLFYGVKTRGSTQSLPRKDVKKSSKARSRFLRCRKLYDCTIECARRGRSAGGLENARRPDLVLHHSRSAGHSPRSPGPQVPANPRGGRRSDRQWQGREPARGQNSVSWTNESVISLYGLEPGGSFASDVPLFPGRFRHGMDRRWLAPRGLLHQLAAGKLSFSGLGTQCRQQREHEAEPHR